MQIVILIALCVECIGLALLAFLKKLTKKAFICISLTTFVCCCVALFLSNLGYSAEKKENQEENIYIAARLVQEEKAENAQNLLGKAIDSEYEKYGIQNLRGLIFELTGAYDVTLIYLEDVEDENAQKICLAAMDKKPVEKDVSDAVTAQTIEALNFEDEKVKELEAKIQLQYLNTYEEKKEDESEGISEIESREQYFDEVVQKAEEGSLQDVITVSNLYVENYILSTLETKDEAYDKLLEEATEVQIRLNETAVKLEKNTEIVNEQVNKSDVQKEYEAILAEYNIILDEMSCERVKRAINYLEANKPHNSEKNIAYQLQMAILYYQATEKEKAEECLDRIFMNEVIDRSQWLGLDCYLLRESYLESIGSGNDKEFEMMFYQTMNNLGQNNNRKFLIFLKDYFESRFRGLVIGKIDISNYPEIIAEVSVSEEALVLEEKNISIYDTEEAIENIEISQKETSELAICFVLDRSGSMAGSNLKDSKKAIRESVMTWGEDVKVGLVTFESSARIDCALTTLKYAVSAAVDKVQDTGGTDIASGLKCANEVLAAAPGEKVVILLSDGYDGNAENIEEVLTYSKSHGIKVFTIGLSGCDEEYLTYIAESTGGTFIPANKTNKLTQIYEEINSYISHTYYVKYEVENVETQRREFYIRMKDSMIQAKKDYSLVEEKKQENGRGNSGLQKSNLYKQIGDALGGGLNE